MINSPNVIVTHKPILSFNSPDRKIKISQHGTYMKKFTHRMLRYFSNPLKAPVTINDFVNETMNELEDSEYVNLIIGYDAKNKKVIYAKKDELDKIAEDDLRYLENSNLYRTVISFNNDFINSNISLKELELEMVKNILPKYFEKIGFDSKKITYQLSLHTDTDNLHFHLAFLEKEPAFKSRGSKKLGYRRKANIDDDLNNFLKKQIQLRVESTKKFNPLVNEVDQELKKIKEKFRTTEKNFVLENAKAFRVEDKILRLGKLLSEERKNKSHQRIAFGSIRNEEIIKLTRQLKKELFDKNLAFNISSFNNAVDNFEKYINQMNDSNNIKTEENDLKIVKKKEEELNSFILNQIVNDSLYFYNTNFSKLKSSAKKDIFLQELATYNYKKTKFKKREAIMDKYVESKNNYYNMNNTYNGYNSIEACPNFHQLENYIKQISNKQAYEVQKLRERAEINWYDKTNY